MIGSFCSSARRFRDTAAWVGPAASAPTRLIEGRLDLTDAPGAFTAPARGESRSGTVPVFPPVVPAAVGAAEVDR